MFERQVLVLVAVLGLAGLGEAYGATRIFQGTQDDKWSVAANWENSTKPAENDSVVIAVSCQLDEAPPALWAFTINQGATFSAGTQAMAVRENWTENGTFACGTSSVTFGYLNDLTVTSHSPFADVTISTSYWSLITSGDMTVNGTLTLYRGNLSGTVHAKGNVVECTDFYGGLGLLKIDGTGNQTLTGSGSETSGSLPLMEIVKPSGMLTLAGSVVRTGEDWTETSSGTLNVNGVKVVFWANRTTVVAKTAFADVTVNKGSGEWLLVTGELTANGGLTLASGVLNGGTVHVRGNLVQGVGFGGGSALLKVDGTGNQTFTGSGSETSGNLPSLEIDKPSGTLTLAGGTIQVGGNWRETSSGTLDVNGVKLVFAGNNSVLVAKTALADVRVWKGSGTGLDVLYEATVAGTLTLTSGALNLGRVHAHGDVVEGTSFAGGSALLKFDGTGNQTLTGCGSEDYGSLPAVEVAKSSGTLTLAGGVIRTSGGWTNTSGTVNPGTEKVVFVAFNQTVKDGLFYDMRIVYGGFYANIAGDLHIKHDLTTDNPTYPKASAARLLVEGTGAQSVVLSCKEINVSNTGGAVTFTDDFSVDKVTLAAGSSVKFTAAKTATVKELAWEGTSGSPITVRSTSDGTQWKLVVPSFQAVHHVDLKDSDASLGEALTDVSGTNSGNDTHWTFGDEASVAVTTGTSSVTSPAWVEGTCGADTVAVKVSVNSGTEFDAVLESKVGWYADSGVVQTPRTQTAMGVPLSATAATTVDIRALDVDNNESTDNKQITWTVTDLTGTLNAMTIRKGDSLLLTSTVTGTALEIDGDGDSTYEFTNHAPGDKYACAYNATGTYTASAKVDGNVVGTVAVTVVEASLPTVLCCQVGVASVRHAVVTPTGSASGLTVTSSDPYVVTVTSPTPYGDGLNVTLNAADVIPARVMLRIGGTSGPALATNLIKPCRLVYYEPGVPMPEVYHDGTAKQAIVIRMVPYVPDAQVHFYTWSGGTTFENGLDVMTKSSNDLGSSPYTFYILGSRQNPGTCHTISILP
jgi:hypothetical protein